jgi:xanthine dehydrogenase iron-sulfur cluster and FAD-binding subunit A
MKLSLEVNGRPVELEIEPQETLAEVLRNRCQLTGVKISCEVQVCGSCTTLVDGQPVSACTFLAYEARNRRVMTIEGLSDGARLHPMQQAFIDEFAFQWRFISTRSRISRRGSTTWLPISGISARPTRAVKHSTARTLSTRRPAPVSRS